MINWSGLFNKGAKFAVKLNTKRTMLVGLAFLSICIFWQMYDSVMTLILTDTFHLNETIAGAVMAADNVLALFLLPLFGAMSDKTNTRIGRRMPYIIGGTAAAVILMNLLPVLDNAYAASPSPLILGLFIAVLALLLVAMGVYRSPAVALMPDVTPKPLRSRGNAVINLMGRGWRHSVSGAGGSAVPRVAQGGGTCGLSAAVYHRVADYGSIGACAGADGEGKEAVRREPRAGEAAPGLEPRREG